MAGQSKYYVWDDPVIRNSDVTCAGDTPFIERMICTIRSAHMRHRLRKLDEVPLLVVPQEQVHDLL